MREKGREMDRNDKIIKFQEKEAFSWWWNVVKGFDGTSANNLLKNANISNKNLNNLES